MQTSWVAVIEVSVAYWWHWQRWHCSRWQCYISNTENLGLCYISVSAIVRTPEKVSALRLSKTSVFNGDTDTVSRSFKGGNVRKSIETKLAWLQRQRFWKWKRTAICGREACIVPSSSTKLLNVTFQNNLKPDVQFYLEFDTAFDAWNNNVKLTAWFINNVQ